MRRWQRRTARGLEIDCPICPAWCVRNGQLHPALEEDSSGATLSVWHQTIEEDHDEMVRQHGVDLARINVERYDTRDPDGAWTTDGSPHIRFELAAEDALMAPLDDATARVLGQALLDAADQLDAVTAHPA
jgi:hypothetical protein